MNTDNMQTSTIRDLLDYVPSSKKLLEYPYSLEEYLRGLWLVAQKNRDQSITPSSIKDMLESAATIEAPSFDEDWLVYTRLPFDDEYQEIDEEFAYFLHVILFQIADLRRMKEAGTLDLDPITLYGGVESPTGNRWYNFSVADYIEAGASGYEAHCRNYGIVNEWTEQFPSKIGHPLDSTLIKWRDLAHILELGQIYE